MLQLLLQNHTTTIDNIVLKNKEEIEERKLKAKDIEIKQLHDLIELRDSVIVQTKKQLTLSKMKLIFEEDALESSDTVLKRMKMSFPTFPISNVGTNLTPNKSKSQTINVRIENKGDGNTTDTGLSNPQNSQK